MSGVYEMVDVTRERSPYHTETDRHIFDNVCLRCYNGTTLYKGGNVMKKKLLGLLSVCLLLTLLAGATLPACCPHEAFNFVVE